jgi:HD superfamily phosphohydrolase
MSHPDGVRDPVHDWITLEDPEWRAVDTPVYQRLRGIHQLAMTYLVYPGTTHTRFEHSLGVRHVAGRIVERLADKSPGLFPEEQQRTVLHAALLHDVGHGPFSHVSEQVLEDVTGAEDIHEKISVALARRNGPIRDALGDAECDAAADLIEGVGGRSVYRDIVSGETDADKLDYLPRDSYFAGVDYGKCDLTRLIDTMVVMGDPAAQTYLGFKASGVFAVEGLVLARHHMFRQVYAHKTRVATDIMITRALRAAIDEGVLPRNAYEVPLDDGKPAPTDEFLERFLEQTDASVLETMLNASGDGLVSRDLAERLVTRRLLRQTVNIPLHRAGDRLDRRKIAAILDPAEFTREKIAEVEQELAAAVGEPPHLVALYLDKRRNPTFRLPGTSSVIDEKQIVLERNGNTVYLEDESEIFRPLKGEDQSYLFLYAPPLDEKQADRARDLLWEILAR